MTEPIESVEAIRNACEVLFPSGSVVEVRLFGALKGRDGTISGYYDAAHFDQLARDVQKYKQARSVYVTLNEVDPALHSRYHNRLQEYAKETTSDHNINRRRWLPIDCDPVRPSEVSSSDTEHQAALARVRDIRAFLIERKFPAKSIVCADSGNGAHLLVRIDLPNDADATKLVTDCLKALAAKFDDGVVQVDQKVFNAARIFKLYGTWARKGDDTPERPHRLARLAPKTPSPESIAVAERDLLEALAAEAPQPEQQRTPNNFSHASPSGPFDMAGYIARHGLVTRDPIPYEGGTKWQMDCLFNPDHKSPDAFLQVTASGAASYACSHNSCAGNKWHQVRDLIEPGWSEEKARREEAFSAKNNRNGSSAGFAGSHNHTREGTKEGSAGFAGTSPPISPSFLNVPRTISIDLLPVPELTEEMIPFSLRSWVNDIAQRGSFSIDFVIAPAIVALSAVVGRRMAIRPKRHDDWTVIPNLWGAVVGPPGIQKTPAVSEALRPLSRLEVEARDEYERAVTYHEIDQTVAKAKAVGAGERLKAAAKKVGSSDDELRQLAMEAMGGEAGEPPVCRRYMVNDTTVEKLGELLKENPEGLLMFRDELTGFFKTMERQGHESDRAFYLEAWTGTGSYTYDRIGRGTIVIPSTCVSLFGTIQPGPLSRYLRTAASGEEADGFAPRLQILVYPDPPRTFINVDRYPSTVAKTEAFEIFKELAGLNPADYGATMEEDGQSCLPYLRFASDAQEFFDSWRTVIENRLREGRDTPLMQTHLAKYRSLMPSLALLFHLIEGQGTRGVSLSAARLAADWCAFLEAHARRVYQSAMDGDPEAAQRLAERIKQSLPNPFTPREVVKKGWSGLSTTEEVDKAVGLLEEKGWVQTVEVPSGTQGGRPSTQVWINPALLSDPKENNSIPMGVPTGKTGETPETAPDNPEYIPSPTGKTGRTYPDKVHSTPDDSDDDEDEVF